MTLMLPGTLVQGDSATWADGAVRLADGRTAQPGDGWALRYALRGPSQLDVAAVVDGTVWRSTIAATASANLLPGLYAWSATVALAAERLTIGQGQLRVSTDLAALTTATDPRSPAQRALDDCEAALARFSATGGKVKRYDIAGRSMEFEGISDLMALRAFWAARVANEAAARSDNGGTSRNVYIRFTRPQ